MKQITPITIWANGQEVQCDALDAFVLNDNLISEATFFFAIGNISQSAPPASVTPISQGRLTMTGPDYIAYGTNQYAWDWVASTLNLTIIGDYQIQ